MIRKLLGRWASESLRAAAVQLEKRVADLEAEVEARDRLVKVIEAERDAMAAVIARDRERIRAEGASYARQRAEAEGVMENEQRRPYQSVG